MMRRARTLTRARARPQTRAQTRARSGALRLALHPALILAMIFAGLLVTRSLPVQAADMVETARPPLALKGIWAAIAYSPSDGEHGFFWGADEREEAASQALAHCRNAGGESCRVTEVYRNKRNWWDEPVPRAPYRPCGALAVGDEAGTARVPWGSATAVRRADAEERALVVCEANGDQCEIREWVCT